MAKRTSDEVRRFLEEVNITVKGTNVPRPVTTFEEASFPSYISDTLFK